MRILVSSGFTFLVGIYTAFTYYETLGIPHETSVSLILTCTFWLSLLIPQLNQLWKQAFAITLGCFVLGCSLGISLRLDTPFMRYISLFCYFHFSEFLYISFSHGSVKFDSLMLNHGVQYAMAFTMSSLEHFFSPFHFTHCISSIGFGLSITGLFIRASALLTAGKAFTHLISTNRLPSHKLVVDGIYGYMRHPGYCGWLIWVVSSQMLAGNPISCVAFAVVTWYFFQERIEYEESVLFEMFGKEYGQYRQKVKFSGVPFIR